MKHLLLPALLLSAAPVWAWGPLGHRIVGQLAENRLSPAAKDKLRAILGKETLADVANWPDFVRSDPAWKKADPWHYVSVEDGKKYGDKRPSPDGDVLVAMKTFREVVTDPKAPVTKRRDAVAFLVHFVGDVHQPLHVGRAGDRGGNTIELRWLGEKTNLHWIWDSKLLEVEQMSYSDYVRFIDKASPEQEKAWAEVPVSGWTQEAMALRPLVYGFPTKPRAGWEWAYRFKALPVAHEQLLKAGVRLAAMLEQALTGKANP